MPGLTVVFVLWILSSLRAYAEYFINERLNFLTDCMASRYVRPDIEANTAKKAPIAHSMAAILSLDGGRARAFTHLKSSHWDWPSVWKMHAGLPHFSRVLRGRVDLPNVSSSPVRSGSAHIFRNFIRGEAQPPAKSAGRLGQPPCVTARKGRASPLDD
jgi:hypothetical protein